MFWTDLQIKTRTRGCESKISEKDADTKFRQKLQVWFWKKRPLAKSHGVYKVIFGQWSSIGFSRIFSSNCRGSEFRIFDNSSVPKFFRLWNSFKF